MSKAWSGDSLFWAALEAEYVAQSSKASCPLLSVWPSAGLALRLEAAGAQG